MPSIRSVAIASSAVCTVVGGLLLWKRWKAHSVESAHPRSDRPVPPCITPPADGDDKEVVHPSAPVDTPERRQAFELFHALKGEANSAFQRSDIDRALMGYQDALDVLAALPGNDLDVISQSQIVRANIVMAFIKVGMYDQACMLATFVLQEDNRCLPVDLKVKLLYRRAVAMIKLGDLVGGKGDLMAAKQFSSKEDPAIETELANVNKLLAAK